MGNSNTRSGGRGLQITRRTTLWLSALLWCVWSAATHAALIGRDITIDGNISDWTTAPNITTNPSQFSTDGDGRSCPSTDLDTGSPCKALTPSGRDLKTFAFTWNSSNLYIYVERWAGTSNVTDWWFYLDMDANGRMEDGEPVLRVNWNGNTGSTDRFLYDYDAVDNTLGDLLVNPVGDGYTMPGSAINETALASATGGTADQAAMESWIAWSDITASGNPQSLNFHIAASNGTNIPSSIIDNMDGPAGGTLSFPDLSVSKTASAATVVATRSFSYTVTITNNGDADATGITLQDTLPAGVSFVPPAVASQGSYDSGTGIWTVGAIPYTTPTLSSATLTLNVTANSVTSDTVVSNTANNLVLNEADPDTSNNSASVNVTVTPLPNITVTKSASAPTVDPGQNITYTTLITNTSNGIASQVMVEDTKSPYTWFRVDSYGAGVHINMIDIAPLSGLTMGTPEFSSDNGATWTYVPTSGAGGAPAGYDGLVTNWRVLMTGSMNASSSFSLTNEEQVK